MFTPQQIDQISFSKASFGGYNMEQVDAILEPLTEDYVTLYKENALLKSKMRVLVGKLEEYRKNEATMKDAVTNAQLTADKMVREAELKCAQMMNAASASAAAARSTVNADALIATENARVEEARRLASARINELMEQLRSCMNALERIKNATPGKPAPVSSSPDAVADEISQNLEALVGSVAEPAPVAAPRSTVSDSTASKFANLNLQFGRNYDPTH